MTEPSKAALKRADELIRKMSDEIWHERYIGVLMADCSPTLDVRAEGATKAFARYIENTSDVAKEADRGFDKCGYGDAPGSLRHKIKSLILDDEPDPLEQVMASLFCANSDAAEIAADLRVELKARGLKIVQSDD